MKGGAAVTGCALSVAAWFVIVVLWSGAAEYLNHLMGMRGGDVEGPYVLLIGGAILALALGLVVIAALTSRVVSRLTGYGAVGLTAIAEWVFAGYLDALKRFISPEYDSITGARPTQLVSDEVYHWISWSLIGLHVIAVAISIAGVFVVSRWIADLSKPDV